jgi:hypothetical protein
MTAREREEPAKGRRALVGWDGLFASVWAVGAVGATFVEAIYRLGARALALVHSGLSRGEWMLFGVTVVAFVYVEGHRVLERRFVPRVVGRALELCRAHDARSTWLAPLYVLSLFGAPRREVLRGCASVVLIVLAVLGVRRLPDTYRGMVDGGVAAALGWGLVALAVRFAAALWTTRRASRLSALRAAGPPSLRPRDSLRPAP